MFVDSRYWVQAERELDNNWVLHRVGEPHVSNWDVWILVRSRLIRSVLRVLT